MSDLRDKFKKLTGNNCKITRVYNVENCEDFSVKMFDPKYVDWLERKLAKEANKSTKTALNAC